jgi:hypothetical protein
MPLTRQLRPIGPYKLLGKVVEGFKRGSKEVRLRCRPISLLQQLICAPLVSAGLADS